VGLIGTRLALDQQARSQASHSRKVQRLGRRTVLAFGRSALPPLLGRQTLDGLASGPTRGTAPGAGPARLVPCPGSPIQLPP
jgi:hypothetical protein